MITTMLIPYDTSKLFTKADLFISINNEKKLISINEGYHTFVEIIVTFNQEINAPFEQSLFTIHFDVYLFLLFMLLISHKK